MYGSHRQVGTLLPQKRREWLGRVRGPDGRQRWIRAADLRPASGSQPSEPSQMIGATFDKVVAETMRVLSNAVVELAALRVWKKL
jgi:hypothetical protein